MNLESQKYEIDALSSWFVVGTEQAASPIDRILTERLKEEFERFETTLESALKPQDRYLTETEKQIYRRGKKVRPMLLFLCARLYDQGPVSHKVVKAAVSLEMLHVATLIHDDIIDNALFRRGLESVNVSRGTNTAILLGDMQFVQAIRTFVDAIETESEMGLVKLVLDTAFRICCGELDEIQTDPTWETEKLRSRYFEIIERKTAIMFGLACETGAALADSRSRDARRLGFYGRRIGRAFQIMDDVLDIIQSSAAAGKKQGTDLLEKRLTLPVIYAMEELGEDSVVGKIMRSTNPVEEPELIKGLNEVKESQAVNRAYADARSEAIDALEYLKLAPVGNIRSDLEELALFIVDRKI